MVPFDVGGCVGELDVVRSLKTSVLIVVQDGVGNPLVI